MFRISKSFIPGFNVLDVSLPTTPTTNAEGEDDPESATKSPLGFKFPAFTLPNLPTLSSLGSTNNTTKNESKQDEGEKTPEESQPTQSKQQQGQTTEGDVNNELPVQTLEERRNNTNNEKNEDTKVIDNKDESLDEKEKLEGDGEQQSSEITTTMPTSKLFGGFKMRSIRLPSFSSRNSTDPQASSETTIENVDTDQIPVETTDIVEDDVAGQDLTVKTATSPEDIAGQDPTSIITTSLLKDEVVDVSEQDSTLDTDTSTTVKPSLSLEYDEVVKEDDKEDVIQESEEKSKNTNKRFSFFGSLKRTTSTTTDEAVSYTHLTLPTIHLV